MGQVSARYSWSDDSAVKAVDIIVSADGKKQSAKVYAGDQVEKGGLAKIPSALTRYGFSNIFADVEDGKNVLVIDGVKDAEKVIAALSALGVTKGDPQKETFKVQLEKVSKGAWLKRNALNINGVFGVAGHVAMAGTGHLQNDKDRLWNGVLGTLNPLLLGICGNGKQNLEFEPMFEGMQQYFAAEGLQLPVFTEQHKQSLVDTVKHFVSGHAVPIAFGVGTLAGYKGLKSAWNQVSKGQGGHARLAAISSSMLGSIMVLAIPEKSKSAVDVEKEKDQTLPQEISTRFKQFSSNPVEAIQAAPMFWDGVLKFLDNILYGYDTYDEIKKINHKWANNRTYVDPEHPERSYKATADRIIKNFKELGVDVADPLALAEVIVPKGRTSSKFGLLGKMTEGQGEILAEMREAQGFKQNGHQDIVKLFGEASESNRALFSDIESFARLEEEAVIATSKLGQKSPWLAGVTASTFAIATLMEAMASKNRDASYMQGDAYQKLFAMSARMVNDVPEEERAFVIHKMAVYLAGQSDVHNAGITSERIEAEITKRVNAMNSSPWMPHSSGHIQQALRVSDAAIAAAQGQGASV